MKAMNSWIYVLVLPLAAMAGFVTVEVFASQDKPAQAEEKASWEARVIKAERSRNRLTLEVSFRYVGIDSEVPAPVIKVRDATGQEWSSLSDTKGGRDKDCIVWLSMGPFIAIGLKPPTLPRTKVDSCQESALSYFFALPGSAKPPFELLFADARPVIVNLK